MTQTDIETLVLRAQKDDGGLRRAVRPLPVDRLRHRPGRGCGRSRGRPNWPRTCSSTACEARCSCATCACFAGWLRQITVRMAINRQTRSKRLTCARDPT